MDLDQLEDLFKDDIDSSDEDDDKDDEKSSKEQEDKSSKKKKKDETKSNNPEPLTDEEKNTDSYKDFKKQYEKKNITPPDEKSFSDQFKDDNIELSNEQLEDVEHVFDEDEVDNDVYETLDDDDDDNDISDEDSRTDIIKLNEEIDNINVFRKHMLEKGYKEVSNRFLAKNFAEASKPDKVYSVNVTVNDGIITAITAYDQDNKIVNMPNSVIKAVKNDINESITPFI